MTTPTVARALRELSAALLPEADALARSMADRIAAEVEVYRDGSLVTDEQLLRSSTENVQFVLGNLAGRPVVGPGVPRATGTSRAEQGIPYAALLQAYRIGGRFIWELLVERSAPETRDDLLRAAAEIWAVTDQLSEQVTDGYRAAVLDRARRDSQARAALLSTLLDGDAAVAEQLLEAATALSLPRGADFAVISAECPAAGVEAVARVEQLLRSRNVLSVWRLDKDRQDGLVALRAGFDSGDLLGLLSGLATGRIGVSDTFDRIGHAPEARRQARLACASATPGTAQVVRYPEHPVPVLLASIPDGAGALARAVLGPVLDLPEPDRSPLIETARIWLAVSGSTSTAAAHLHVHRNTVGYRLGRFEELTGRELRHPVQAAELHIALEAARILGLA